MLSESFVSTCSVRSDTTINVGRTSLGQQAEGQTYLG